MMLSNNLWRKMMLVISIAIVSLPIAGYAHERSDTEQIEALISCYAKGTDTIGDGKTQTDPEAAGLAIYRQCFTEDATFAVWYFGMPFDSLTFPSRAGDKPPAMMVKGVAAWAQSTNTAFRGAGGTGYDFVQHNISNVDVAVTGDSGQLTAYLSSVHIIQGPAAFAPTRCRQQVNGTYSLRLKKVAGQWKIVSLDLAQISVDSVVENGAGCSAPSI